MKFFVALVVFMGFVVIPTIAACDCVDLGRANDFYIEGAHTILFYAGRRPYAQVSLPYCILYSDSSIRLTTSYTCDTDRIVVDGEECMIGSVKSASTSQF